MISYHPEPYDEKKPAWYAGGWLVEPSTDLEVIADVITRHVWSPCMFRGGYRKEKNFMRADYLTFDFENKDFPLEKAFYEFKDYSHIIGTTRNHRVLKDGEVKDRFRVLIKFEEPIKDSLTYIHNLEYALKYYPADKKCKDAARFFYPCKEIVSVQKGWWGGCDVQKLPHPISYYEEQKKYIVEKAKRQNELRSLHKLPPPWTFKMMNSVIPVGERNQTIYKIAKDLFKVGYSKAEVISQVMNLSFSGGLDEDLKKSIGPTVSSAYKGFLNE